MTGPGVPPWLRVAFRIPDTLYARGLGFLLGSRFLRLRHVGRRSGHPYTTVLEVLGRNRDAGLYVVVSGFGERSDWLRNLEAGGPAEVTCGRSTFPVEHRRLTEDEAVVVLERYERRNRLIVPLVRRALSWLVGWRYDGSAAARRDLVHQLPVVLLRRVNAT
ncbi:MAG: nitroreductase family deazaflavin-dependent oxidoreductase [Pseudonocardia sp.]